MLTGIDLISTGQASALRRRIRNARLGVLTHAAALDRKGRRTLDVLDELGVSPTTLFTPEHGLEGVAQAEEPVGDELAAPIGAGGARVISLYGTDRASLTPTAEQFEDLDVLLIDIVDVGSRYYTYVWTALLALRAAAAAGKHVVLLDRPNPLGGNPRDCEGALPDPAFLSFVGLEPLAIRHGLTVGEILATFAERDGLALGPDGALSIINPLGWERFRSASSWGRPFIAPSPNMPTLETALVYPGACLLEGTALSEGRGTTLPFQTVGAPHLDAERLARELREYGVPGAWVCPTAFRPTFGKHAGLLCHGVCLHVTDPALFRPVSTYLALITLARSQNPEQFAFATRCYEFETERLAFDLLTGSSLVREAIVADARPEDVVALLAAPPPDWAEFLRAAEARAVRASAG